MNIDLFPLVGIFIFGMVLTAVALIRDWWERH